MRGYFGIGIENLKSGLNLGTLWRSAHAFDAAFMFVIGRRYRWQSSDTTKAWRSIPFYHFDSFDEFYEAMPKDCRLVGVEIYLGAKPLSQFTHDERCIYLLGAEDHGLSKKAMEKCTRIVQLPGMYCLNVAVAGSIVMYDRITKMCGKGESESHKLDFPSATLGPASNGQSP